GNLAPLAFQPDDVGAVDQAGDDGGGKVLLEPAADQRLLPAQGDCGAGGRGEKRDQRRKDGRHRVENQAGAGDQRHRGAGPGGGGGKAQGRGGGGPQHGAGGGAGQGQDQAGGGLDPADAVGAERDRHGEHGGDGVGLDLDRGRH